MWVDKEGKEIDKFSVQTELSYLHGYVCEYGGNYSLREYNRFLEYEETEDIILHLALEFMERQVMSENASMGFMKTKEVPTYAVYRRKNKIKTILE